MAQPHADAAAAGFPAPFETQHHQQSILRRIFSGWGKDNGAGGGLSEVAHKGHGHGLEQPQADRSGLIRRVSRKVVPGLPRTQTFKRQRSEVRSRLEPVRPTPAERRTVSMDRRVHASASALAHSDPRASAPDFRRHRFSAPPSPPSYPISPLDSMLLPDRAEDLGGFDLDRDSDSIDGDFLDDIDTLSKLDVGSMTTSQYDALIDKELERKWILNLSMHFRDRSKREKFFVTSRQHEHLWRRVTLSLDYRDAPDNSLEADLAGTQLQRGKSAKIYEAIRDSLAEIEFYNTVTNLKLETKDGRLHVHVVEDANEIISYPPVRMIQHTNCRRIKESEIEFDSHMSGFVYKVHVHGKLLIKKEIPGPDTVDEFLYEINALSQLYPSKNVIQFYGVVVDDSEENVTGLLISYAARGALIDVIYDSHHTLDWPLREKWARQIVGGLSEIHEAGFVQGDLTLSNIVIDENDNAKIIDINRRGCPIGWEPPEATPLVESNQRISMYIGVKSDLYQLGMVLWALATQEDEPDAYGRPLKIDPDVAVPAWYRRIVDTCLSTDPRGRVQAVQLLSWFPEYDEGSQYGRPNGSAMSVDGDAHSRNGCLSPSRIPKIRAVHPPNNNDWAYVGWANHHPPDESLFFPSRGRSPPSPMPSNQGDYDSPRYRHRMHTTWSDTHSRAPPVPSVSDVLAREARGESEPRLRGSDETLETYADGPYKFNKSVTVTSRDDQSFAHRGRSLSRDDHYDDETDHRTSTWGPPPRLLSLSPEDHDRSMDGGSRNREPGINGATRPESQADSGKDLTEEASTPREERSFYHARRDRSVSRGRTGRSSAGSYPLGMAQQRTDLTTTTAESSHDHYPNNDDDNSLRHAPGDNYANDGGHQQYEQEQEHERDDGHPHLPPPEPSDTTPRHIPTSTTHTPRDAEDFLKGIGSVYDRTIHNVNRTDLEMLLDEDDDAIDPLGSELDARLGELSRTTTAVEDGGGGY